MHYQLRRTDEKVTDIAGGPARRKAVVLLAAVLGLSGADVGAIGALAPQLESSFHIGNAGIGFLVTAALLVGAVVSPVFGVLADRTNRTRILSISIAAWAAIQLVSGLAVSFTMLLLIRLALGLATATGGPIVASLTGDLFPAKDRSRIYGMILTGEFLGAGLGVLIAGDIGAATSWRVGLAILALPSALLAWAIYRYFPEPARGGQSCLFEGAEEIPSAESVGDGRDAVRRSPDHGSDEPSVDEHPVLAMVEDRGIEPETSVVLDSDADQSFWRAVRWVFRVRTNLSLIAASALGYFFLSGLRTFALVYAKGRFGIGQGMASILFVLIGIAAVAGVVISGRWTDRWIYRGRADARLIVGGLGFIVATLVFIPALLTGSLLIALPLFVVAGFALAAPNPPVDAARLDVVPSRMWGRVESLRTTVRTVLEAFAPLLFGVLSGVLGQGSQAGFGSGVNDTHAHLSHAATTGLEYTFLIMLVTLGGSGVLLLSGRRTYLGDVATAAASDRAMSDRRRSEVH